MIFDTNKVILTGRIDKIESIKTKQQISAVNILLRLEGKYVDINPCQAYGQLAELIQERFSIGTSVIVIGRLRSVVAKESGKSSNWVVIEKIGEELVIENDGGDTENGFRS